MAYITKRGSSYSVRYTYQDEHGKSCDNGRAFPPKEEATNRKKQIEHELAAGTFLIPSSVTVAEFLMDWLPKQCSKHKWAPKTYESNLSTIQNLIIPYIGSMEMQKLKPYHMENLYTTLSKNALRFVYRGKEAGTDRKAEAAVSFRHHHPRGASAAGYSVPVCRRVGHSCQKSCSCGQPQEVHAGAHHLDGRGNAGGSGQHGGPHPASGSPSHTGGRAARRRDRWSDPRRS